MKLAPSEHRPAQAMEQALILRQAIGKPAPPQLAAQSERYIERPPAAPWDFTDIPVFARDRAEQSGLTIAGAIRQATRESQTAEPPSGAAFSMAMARVHMRDDVRADRSAQLLRAEAVAFGDEILFRSGRYEPETERGRALIAHELTHLAHQNQTGHRYPQRSVAGNILSVQFTRNMAEAMTDQELDQQMKLLRAHLQSEPHDTGAKENLDTLESVAYDRQGSQQTPPPSAPAPLTAAPPQQKREGEEEHGKVWRALHSVGLAQTKHENAELLRRAWGPQSGVVVTDKDGDPVDVTRLSDDEVIALNKKLRGRPIGPPLAAAAVAIAPLACDATGKVHGQLPSRDAINTLKREDLEQSAGELERSIATRKAEQLRLGEDGPHRARIAQEEELLRAIQKKLSGS